MRSTQQCPNWDPRERVILIVETIFSHDGMVRWARGFIPSRERAIRWAERTVGSCERRLRRRERVLRSCERTLLRHERTVRSRAPMNGARELRISLPDKTIRSTD